MRFSLLSLLFVFQYNLYAQSHTFSGELVYRTETVAHSGKPTKQELIRYFVKNELVRVETLTPMGLQVFIRNFATGEGVLLLNMNGQNYALKQQLTSASILAYTFEKGKQKTTIATIKAKQGIISAPHLSEDIHVFYTLKLPGYFIDIYNQLIPGLPIRYSLIVQGEEVLYELVEWNTNEPHPDAFTVPDEYMHITMDEFMVLMTK
jgi:hypothetical protein